MSGKAAHPKNAKAAAAALSIILALPVAARGQGFGLDLSDDDPGAKPAEAPAAPAAASAPAASLGLDLSSDVDYRPSFAFLGLSALDRRHRLLERIWAAPIGSVVFATALIVTMLLIGVPDGPAFIYFQF